MKIASFALMIAMMAVTGICGQAQQPSFLAERVLLSNGGILAPMSPGKLFSIYGQGLGPDVGCLGQAIGAPGFPTLLCKVQVLVGAEPAELLFVQEKQINFKVPKILPAEGSVLVKVVYLGASSSAVALEVGVSRPKVFLEGVARVGGPVWLLVQLPAEVGEVAYPGWNPPLDFGCNQVEVRLNGALLGRRVIVSPQGVVGPGIGCGNDLAYPGITRPHSGRLPIHLQYRFERPGIYEARYTRLRRLFDKQIEAQSDWTTIPILAEITAPPRVAPLAGSEILSDYLPNILGSTHAETLSIVIPFLYHPEPAVRQYAAAALGW